MNFTELTNQIKTLLSKVGGVEVAFGKAETFDGVTVIPVAKVRLGGGGGEGKSSRGKKGKKPVEMAETDAAEANQKDGDYGMGMGGGVTTTPLGVFAIRNGKVEFQPVVTIEKVFGFGLLFLLSILIFGPKSKK